MSTRADLAACESRDDAGYPSMLRAAPGAAITIGGDSNAAQASGASIVWREQAQKWLLPIIVLLILVLVFNAIVMALNLSKQTMLDHRLRDTQVAEDLRKYETQQLRVQAEVNQELIKAFAIIRGCNK